MNQTPLAELAKALMVFGGVTVLAGAVLYFAGRHAKWLGHLPGDLFIQKGNFTFYFPLATSIAVSIVLTLLLNLFRKH